MPKTSRYKPIVDSIPEFIKSIENASENEVDNKCQQIKSAIDQVSGRTEGRRDPRTMSAIRKAVDERFPVIPADSETTEEFPYYLCGNKKGQVFRLEHIAHKYLVDERNPGKEVSDTEVNVSTEVEPEDKGKEAEIKIEAVTLESLGLSDSEMASVKQAMGESDVKEWLKQAVLQRANTINKLRESLDEDWASIPSETLMEEKRYRTNSAACRELVSRAVRVVKQWNHDHPEQKWCITNKLISELTGITVKAIAKAVEGMDNESYNKGQGLEPVINRQTRSTVGEPSEVMSIATVTGIEGSEANYASPSLETSDH